MNEQRPSNEVARRIKRTCEMSAGIMRDKRRTGGWEGAEKVARQFDRLAELASQLESTAHEPSVVRDALEAIASPSRHEDYGWWTQVARRALGYATKNEAAQPPTEPLCPRPFTGRPDIFTMAQCILAGECGCTAAACEARKAQPPAVDRFYGVPRDRPIWICSVCNGWNHARDNFCTNTHAVTSETKEEG